MEFRERYRGALLGLAIGDALGTTLEFKPPGTFPSITVTGRTGPDVSSLLRQIPPFDADT